jgi:L-seryl-tRNA(Ser) seleniumtransferase
VATLRDLPSVDEIARKFQGFRELPPRVLIAEIRAVISERRERLRAGGDVPAFTIEDEVTARLAELLGPSLRPLINATGIILHTNLGRAPLPGFEPIRGYSNLEYDIATGRRGKRDVHTARILERLLERPAVVVNNNAAAVFLVLHELAAGKEVIVSRGELIEIGDGFRIPEIMARSGALLREVGTTNRTRIEDYEHAITEHTGLILRVHRSNFHISGFTIRPALDEIAQFARVKGVPLYEDLGSGCLVDLKSYGIDEPLVAESFRAGVDLVSFSSDKLLGGPQSGIIAGNAELIARVTQNPMYRALRVDKLIIQCLESTLQRILMDDWEAIPTLRMIRTAEKQLRVRAEHVIARLGARRATCRKSHSPIGGGSTPDQMLPTVLVELEADGANTVERRLRRHDPPVIARIERDRVVFDMRTVADDQLDALAAAIEQALTT